MTNTFQFGASSIGGAFRIEMERKSTLYSIFAILFFLVFPGQIIATPSDTILSSQEIRYDQRTDLQPVHFDRQQLANYKNDKDFDYSRKIDAINWWQRFKDWLYHILTSFLESIFGSFTPGSWLYTVIGIVKYFLIAGVLFFIIWLFVRLNPGKALLKTKAPPEVLLSEEEKIIHEEDIPALIHQALQQRDYRLALRYSYLLMLKTLQDKELIEYQHEKTNQEYQKEIESPEIGRQFNRATHLYDFVWYGDFPMNQGQYAQAKTVFDKLDDLLKNTTDE